MLWYGLAFSAIGYGLYRLLHEYWTVSLLGRLRPDEDYAVVFNADSPIGAAFAHALAHRGFSLILLTRIGDRPSGRLTASASEQELYALAGVQNRLQELAADLRRRYKVAVGLFDDNESEETSELDWIRCHAPLLAVWAPPKSKVPASFVEECSSAVVADALKRRTRDLCVFFQAVVPAMKANGRGVILTVGDGSARPSCGTPLHGISSGCSGFVEHYVTSIATELAEEQIVVRHAVQHGICNPLVYPPSAGFPMPREWVDAVLAHAYYKYGAAVCVPHLAHACKDVLLRWTPQALLAPVLGRIRRKERKAMFSGKKDL